MLKRLIVIASLIASPTLALVPDNATPEQQRMAKDWAEYSTACRGGAVDGSQETTLGYCGTASYLDYRLQETGLCYESAARAFTPCDPKTAKNPLEGYPF
jgi:hypothetical protein